MKTVMLFAVGLSALVAAGCGKPRTLNSSADLSKLSHLATLRCEFSVVSFMEHPDPIRGTDKVLEKASGWATISFDLSKASYQHDGDTLVFTLPEAEVLSPTLATRWEKIREHRSGLTGETEYNKWRDDQEMKTQNELVEKAKDPMLLQIAKDRAAMLIKQFYANEWPDLTVVVK